MRSIDKINTGSWLNLDMASGFGSYLLIAGDTTRLGVRIPPSPISFLILAGISDINVVNHS